MNESLIIKEYQDGLSSLKLAKKYNCSKSKILGILKKNKIERRSNKIILTEKQINSIIELYENKVTIEEIVSKLKVSGKKIYEVLNKHGIVRKLNKKINEKTKKNIIKYFNNGVKISEIQTKFNIKSDATIYKILKEKGIKIKHIPHNKIDDIVKDKIINEYVNGLNICELHEIYGYGTTTIARWVKNAGAMRSLSDAFTLSANKGRKYFKGTTLPWYSNKNKKWFIADSIWEATRMKQLDEDNTVLSWEKNTERIPYKDLNEISHYYVPDFKIFYTNKIVVEEIKPSSLLNDKINVIKFEVARQFYTKQNIEYKIVTENEIGIENIKNFKPDGLIKYTQDIRKERRRILRNEREKKKRYYAKINNNRITI